MGGSNLIIGTYRIIPGKCPWALNSSTKNWGWVVTQRRCLNDPTIPVQVPTQDAKLAARGYRINLHHRFARASSRSVRRWKCCIVLESGPTHSLVAKFPQHLSLTVREFRADLLSIQFSMVSGYTKDLKKKSTELSKLGGWHLHKDGCFDPQDNTVM